MKELANKGPSLPRAGEIITGTIMGRENRALFVDLGAQGTGIIFGREFLQAQDLIKHLAEGDQVSAKVLEPENDAGYVELSLAEAGRELSWKELRKMQEEGETLEVKIASANRGGLVIDVHGIPAFMPASQLAQEHYPRVEGGDKEKILAVLQKLVGKVVKVKILDLDPRDEKLILSEKLIEEEALKEQLKAYQVGDTIEGTVSGVVDFGVFIRFDENGALEGLAHISELDWGLVQDPRSLFKEGEKLKAKIIDVVNGRVSLSVKALKKDPWEEATAKLKRGDIVEGTVVKFTPFGAFVQVMPHVQGLVHISEFGNEERMREELPEGQPLKFRMVSLDPKEHHMGLKLPRKDHEEQSGKTLEEESKAPVAYAEVAEIPEEKPPEKRKRKTKTANTETAVTENQVAQEAGADEQGMAELEDTPLEERAATPEEEPKE